MEAVAHDYINHGTTTLFDALDVTVARWQLSSTLLTDNSKPGRLRATEVFVLYAYNSYISSHYP